MGLGLWVRLGDGMGWDPWDREGVRGIGKRLKHCVLRVGQLRFIFRERREREGDFVLPLPGNLEQILVLIHRVWVGLEPKF